MLPFCTEVWLQSFVSDVTDEPLAIASNQEAPRAFNLKRGFCDVNFSRFLLVALGSTYSTVSELVMVATPASCCMLLLEAAQAV